MSDLDGLHAVAQQAAALLRRLSAERDSDSDGGVLSQIAAGAWDPQWPSEQSVRDATEILTSLVQREALTRRQLDALRTGTVESPDLAGDIRGSAAERLPLNRKERYYTGTVLPALVTSDDFQHLPRLLDLCGLRDITIESGAGLQFFTEYSFAESVFLDHDKRRFADAPALADTPDLVIAGPDWLLAIEAKVFDQPSAANLSAQLAAQGDLVAYWAHAFHLAPHRVAHVALLPSKLARRIGHAQTRPIVLWEDVADAYRAIAPGHWLTVLDVALSSGLYGSETYGFGANAHAVLTGAEIAAGAAEPSSGDPFTTMGRFLGLDGKHLAADISTGRWRRQEYEVRRDGIPNRNWFTIGDFLALLHSAQALDEL